jgi:hypothetical protein
MSMLPVTLPRRLAACVYDGLLALGIAMLTALIVSLAGTALYGKSPPPDAATSPEISANANQNLQVRDDIASIDQAAPPEEMTTWSINPDDPVYLSFQRIIVGCAFGMVSAFYLFFWWRRGQTLGMASWRIRVTNQAGGPITLAQAITRFIAVFVSLLPAGLGFWWALLEPDGRTWHDRMSGTMLVHEPKPKS